MGMGQELKDFVAGFKAGSDILDKSRRNDQRDRQLDMSEDKMDSDDLYRRGYDSEDQRDQDLEFQRGQRALTDTPGGVGTGATPGATPQTPGRSGGGGQRVPREVALDAISRFESNDRNVHQNIVPPGGGYNPSVGRRTPPSSASGLFQMINPTWKRAAALAGIDAARYPTAMSAPPDLQRKAAGALYDREGFAPWAPYNARLRSWVNQNAGQTWAGAAPPAQAVPAEQDVAYADPTEDVQAFAEGGAVGSNYGAPRAFTQAVGSGPTGAFIPRRVGEAPRGSTATVAPHAPGPSIPNISVANPGAIPHAPLPTQPNVVPPWGTYDPDKFAVRDQVRDPKTGAMINPKSYVDELGAYSGPAYATQPRPMDGVDPNSAQGRFRALQQTRYDTSIGAHNDYDAKVLDAQYRDAAEAEARRRHPPKPVYVPNEYYAAGETGGGGGGGYGGSGGWGSGDGGYSGGVAGGSSSGWGSAEVSSGDNYGGGGGYGGSGYGGDGGVSGTGGLYARGGMVQRFAEGGAVPDGEEEYDASTLEMDPQQQQEANDRLEERQRLYLKLEGSHPSDAGRPNADAITRETVNRPYSMPGDSAVPEAGPPAPLDPSLRGKSADQMTRELLDAPRDPRLPPPDEPAALPGELSPPIKRDGMGLPVGHPALAPANPSMDPRLDDMRKRVPGNAPAPEPKGESMPAAIWRALKIDPKQTQAAVQEGLKAIQETLRGKPAAPGAPSQANQAQGMAAQRDYQEPEPPLPPARPPEAVPTGAAPSRGEFNWETKTFPNERMVANRAGGRPTGPTGTGGLYGDPLASDRAASPQDMAEIFRTVDPQNKLDREGKILKAMNDQRDFWIAQGRPERAAQMGMSIMLYTRKVSQASGLMAIAALDAGDTNAAAKLIQQAYSNIPDGKGLTFKILTDGNIEYRVVGADGKVTAPARATPDDLRVLATRVASGQQWTQEMMSIADPRYAVARERGARQPAARAPTQKDRDRTAADQEHQASVQALNDQADQVEATDPKKAKSLRVQADFLGHDRAYNDNKSDKAINRTKINEAISTAGIEGPNAQRIGNLAEQLKVGNPEMSDETAVETARQLADPKSPEPKRLHNQWRLTGMGPFFATWDMMKQAQALRNPVAAPTATPPKQATAPAAAPPG